MAQVVQSASEAGLAPPPAESGAPPDCSHFSRPNTDEHWSRVTEVNEKLVNELEQGAVPEIIQEELRMIAPESEVGQRFQHEMMKLARLVAPADRDFEKEPVIFALLENDTINACALRPAKPPIICFNSALFDRSNPEAPQTLDERLALLIHEGAHAILGEQYGLTSSSKGEEALADLMAVRVLDERGFDARALLNLMERKAERREPRSVPEFLDRIFDPHPFDETRIGYVQAELTRLDRKERGLLNVEPTPIPEDDPFDELVKAGKHISYIDRCAQEADFDNLSSADQLDFVRELLPQLDDWNSVRELDLAKLIGKIELSWQNLSAEEEQAVNDLTDALYEQILIFSRRFAEDVGENVIFVNKEAERNRLYYKWRRQYAALTQDAFGLSEMFPLGRLRSISDSAYRFLESRSQHEAAQNSTALLECIDSEPLAENWLSREFLRELRWPRMLLPDYPGETVAWNHLVNYALSEGVEYDSSVQRALAEINITHALLELGVEDSRLFGLLQDDDLVQLFRQGRFLAHTWVPTAGISQGDTRSNHYGRRSSYSVSLDHFRMGSDGTILERAEDYEGFREITRENRAKKWEPHTKRSLLELVLNAPPHSPNHCRVVEENIVRLWGEFGTQDRPIGLEHLAERSKFVSELNEKFLKASPEGQAEVVGEFKRLLAANKQLSDPIDLRKVVHAFYGDAHSAHMDVLYEYHSEKDGPTHSPLGMPLAEFFIQEQAGLFTTMEKTRRLFNVAAGLLRRKDLQTALPHLPYVLPENLCTHPTDWGQLIEQVQGLSDHLEAIDYQEDAYHRHEDQDALVAYSEMIARDPSAMPKPTTKEMADFVELVRSPHCCYYDQSDSIRDVFTRTMCDDELCFSADIKEAVREWCLLLRSAFSAPDKIFRQLQPLIDRVKTENLTLDERIELLEQVLCKTRISDPKLREETHTLWAGFVREKFGTDDGTLKYRSDLAEVLKRADEFAGDATRATCLNELAITIESQWGLTKEIAELIRFNPQEKLTKLAGLGIAADFSLNRLRRYPQHRRELTSFLLRPLSQDSVDTISPVIEELAGKVGDLDKLSPIQQERYRNEASASARSIWENFWEAPLEIRAILARELILPVGASEKETEEAFEFVLDRLLGPDDPDAERVRQYVKAYIEVVPDYQKGVLLTALTIAAEPSEDKKYNLGKTLAIVGSALGPGENKYLQAAHSHPSTREDIRKELVVSKVHAAEPTRVELMELINEKVPVLVQNEIHHVGKVRGSASFYITVEVIMRDGSKQALQILRRGALNRARSGVDMIRQAIEKRAEQEPASDILLELADESERAWNEEIDSQLGERKLLRGAELYDELEINVDGETLTLKTPQIYSFEPGIVAWGEEYRIVSFLEGEHFVELAESVQEVDRDRLKTIAKGMGFLAFHDLGAGLEFDDDIHGGNLLVESDWRTLGRIDFGGLSLTPPTAKELSELAHAFGHAFKTREEKGDFALAYFDYMKKLKAKNGSVPSLLKKAQKLLLSLAEYDRLLSDLDRLHILTSAFESAHPAFLTEIESAIGESTWQALNEGAEKFLGPKIRLRRAA